MSIFCYAIDATKRQRFSSNMKTMKISVLLQSHAQKQVRWEMINELIDAE
jgi:hypothetical protein